MNTGKLIAVVGLPGSGKSTLVKAIGSSVSGLCCEDFHANAFDHSPRVERSRHYNALLEHMRAGRDCIIADIAFCDPRRRLSLQEAIDKQFCDARILWIYFENAPAKCRNSIPHRARASVRDDLAALEQFEQVYGIPGGVIPLPICVST